ncbi:MAG: hypothetical protein LC785_04945 [Acidobacteria bacterium]|nr:hypothetical protein [Acidobacteriota bacterium]
MTRLKRLSVAAPLLALLFLLPAEAFADNVVITGGTVVMIDGSSASQVTVNLTGANSSWTGSATYPPPSES